MALIFLMITSVINIILDIYFIKDLYMRIVGAIVVTVITQFVSVICCIVYIYKKVYILISSIIKIFREIFFVIVIIAKMGTFIIMICEPLIWILMTI